MLSRLSNRLSSGKRLNKPSDDPDGMMRSMDYKVSINEIEQYKNNIDSAESYLSYTETTMSSVTNFLTRARELAVQAANGTHNAQTRQAFEPETANLRDEVLRLSNSQYRSL
jgi:flagellar hook-associated protein 3 FlgL